MNINIWARQFSESILFFFFCCRILAHEHIQLSQATLAGLGGSAVSFSAALDSATTTTGGFHILSATPPPLVLVTELSAV